MSVSQFVLSISIISVVIWKDNACVESQCMSSPCGFPMGSLNMNKYHINS